MLKLTTCAWCLKIVTEPKHFRPHKHEVVCSDACAQYEKIFRECFSNKNIGEANMGDFGINPNNRGKRWVKRNLLK